MISIDLIEKYPSDDFIISHSDSLFIFDYDSKKNFDNTFTLDITGNNIDTFKQSIIYNIVSIKKKLFNYKSIVFSTISYGKQLQNLSDVYSFFNQLMKFNFDYDNINRRKWFKIPSYNDTISAEYVNLSNDDGVIISNNNTFFRPEHLKNELYSTYDLIKSENKISFSSNKDYKIGQNLILQFNNQKKYILCRIILSYDSQILNEEDWSLFEGLTTDFCKSINRIGYTQFHIRFISEIDDKGNIVFREDIFKEIDPNIKPNSVDMSKPPSDISNQDIYNLLVQINSKLDRLIK